MKLSLIFALVLVIGSVNAATIKVVPGQSIQEAIDKANSGDTIEVVGGIYYENVNLYKEIKIIGINDGKSNPIIDAHGSGSAIQVVANECLVKGFRLTNSPAGNYSDMYPAGIEIRAENTTVEDNDIINNFYGISILQSIKNSILKNNVVGNKAAGIMMLTANENVIAKNVLRDNIETQYSESIGKTYSGKGIHLFKSNYNNVSDNIIEENCEGVFLDSSNVNQILDNTINKNINGVFIQSSTDNVISQNHISSKVDGIELDNSRGNQYTKNEYINNKCAIMDRDTRDCYKGDLGNY